MKGRSKHPPSFIKNPQQRVLKRFRSHYGLIIDAHIAASPLNNSLMSSIARPKTVSGRHAVQRYLTAGFQIAYSKRRGSNELPLHRIRDAQGDNVLFFKSQMPKPLNNFSRFVEEIGNKDAQSPFFERRCKPRNCRPAPRFPRRLHSL